VKEKKENKEKQEYLDQEINIIDIYQKTISQSSLMSMPKTIMTLRNR